MIKKIVILGMIMTMLAFAGCNQAEEQKVETKPYMAGSSWGDTREAVEAREIPTEIMGHAILSHVYMFSNDGFFKSSVYELQETEDLDKVVATFTDAFGEGIEGFRGENNEYKEFSWRDGDTQIFAMQKIDEGNVIIQFQKVN